MIKISKYIIVWLLFLLFTNCDDSPTNIQKLDYTLSLSFVATPDSVRQKGLLSYTKLVDTEYSNYAKLVDSADFFINKTKLFYNSSPDLERYYSRERYYNYYSDSLNLKLGDTLELSITKNNITITGETIIPGEFRISTAGKTISWTNSNNAYYYLISLANEERTFIWQTSTDQLSVIIDDKNFIEDNYEIVVSAYDRNYYNYYEEKTTHTGLEGAYGIFSAVNRVKITARLY